MGMGGSMTIHAELQWRGITPPPEGQHTIRTVCPICSPYRNKRTETCARLTIISPDAARLFCYHCGADERFSA